MTSGESQDPVLRSVEKAIQVLEEVVYAGRPVGVTELARRVRLSPSTVYRILATLKKARFVAQDSVTSDYMPGTALWRLSGSLLASLEPRKVARPYMERLAAQTGESVNLMIPDGDRGMYIDSVQSNHSIRMVVEIGTRERYHVSAVGKAILAFLPDQIRNAIISTAGLTRLTKNTITDYDELIAHLEEVRRRGYAIDDEEGALGIRCVGAPIFDETGNVIAGLSVSGPAFRLSVDHLHEMAPLVVRVTREISEIFGYDGTRVPRNNTG